MSVTLDIRGRMARVCRLAAIVLCLLPALPSASEDTQTLLTIMQEGSVIGTFSLGALEAAGAVAETVEDDSGQSSADHCQPRKDRCGWSSPTKNDMLAGLGRSRRSNWAASMNRAEGALA